MPSQAGPVTPVLNVATAHHHAMLIMLAVAILAVLCYMMPAGLPGHQEVNAPFQTWVQDLMRWSICSELQPINNAQRSLRNWLAPRARMHAL